MKTNLGKIVAIAWLCMTDSSQALQPEVLYGFQLGSNHLGPMSPYAGLIQGSDGNLYGTTYEGGSNYNGTVFKVTTNGVLTTLVSFDSTVYNGGGAYTNANGASPGTALAFGREGHLYGTTGGGGGSGLGTVFRVTTSGILTSLASFDGTNGDYPHAGLLLGPDGDFYGTTLYGGNNGHGTVFKVTTNGVLTTLVSFNGTNGAYPGELVFGYDGAFYGTTGKGGNGFTGYGTGSGTVFKVTTNGVLTTLVSFNGTNGAFPGELVFGPDGTFYGTTAGGGNSNRGTLFRLTPTGALTTVVSFDSPYGYSTKALALGHDGAFYGTTSQGGSSDYGTVFKVSTNGLLATLVSFDGPNEYYPSALMLGNDGSFYGTTQRGGGGFGIDAGSGFGTVFRVTTNGVLTTLVSFASFYSPDPKAGLVQGADGHFYGTTGYGGNDGYGTVFKVTTNGVLTTLISFNGFNGAGPRAKLLLGNEGSFYGTTASGGSGFSGFGTGSGTVFKVTTNGVLTTLVAFDGTNGAYPQAALVLGKDGNFFGTTSGGGGGGGGTIFKLTTNGVLTTLVAFDGAGGNRPSAGLVLGTDGDFYGTTIQYRESGSYGTVFKVTPSGVLATLVSFLGGPQAELVLGSDGSLYGTTFAEGRNRSGIGTVFRVTTNGELTTLVSFDRTNGAYPQAALVLGKDGNFYGTTSSGGGPDGSGSGTVFRVTPTGALTTLASFDGANGAYPNELLIGNDGYFYGTTSTGGPGGGGTIFRLVISAFTSVARQPGGSVLLTGTGPANGSYRLWASTDLSLPVATWTHLTSASFDSNGNFSLTDAGAVTNTSRFYQLSVP